MRACCCHVKGTLIIWQLDGLQRPAISSESDAQIMREFRDSAGSAHPRLTRSFNNIFFNSCCPSSYASVRNVFATFATYLTTWKQTAQKAKRGWRQSDSEERVKTCKAGKHTQMHNLNISKQISSSVSGRNTPTSAFRRKWQTSLRAATFNGVVVASYMLLLFC